MVIALRGRRDVEGHGQRRSRQIGGVEGRQANRSFTAGFNVGLQGPDLRLAGVELVSVTAESRLNDYFPAQSAESVLERIASEVGDPAQESTRGLYTEQVRRTPDGLGPMRDYKPHHWGKDQTPRPPSPASPTRQTRLTRAVAAVKEIPVSIREEG